MTIMVLTHRAELRQHIGRSLQTRGHEVCFPDHRTAVAATAKKESHPHLVVLDMYLNDPSGARILSGLRNNGYQGAVIAMAGPSSVVSIEHSHPLAVHRVVKLPVPIGEGFDLGELETAIDGVSQP